MAERASEKPTPARRPALWAAGLFALGLVVARETGEGAAAAVGSGVWFAVAAAFGLVAAALRGRAWRAAAAGAMVALGAGWFALRVQEAPADFLGRALAPASEGIAAATGATLTVEGVVLERPDVGAPARGRLARFLALPASTRFPLRVERVVSERGGAEESRAASGALWVRVGEAMSGVRAGDRVRITGIAEGVSAPLNPGEPDARLWAGQRRVAGFLQVSSRALVMPLGPAESTVERLRSGWIGGADAVRAGARAVLGRAMDEGEGDAPARAGGAPEGAGRAMLGAMLLGERDDESLREVQGAFMRLGVSHVLAISGLHLTLLAGAALLALRATGDRGALEPIIVALLVLVYLVIVPAQAPVVRASIMTLGILAAEASGRRYDRLNLLAWIALVVLVWRPMELWAAGFQLSFGVVAALMTLTGPVSERWFGARPDPDTISRRAWAGRRAKDLFVASVVAWAVSAPCVAAHFGVFSPLAVLTNMVIVPLMMALLGAAYGVMLVAAALPSVGDAAGPALAVAGAGIARLALALDGAPGMAAHLPRIGPLWAGASTIVLVWWLRFGVIRDPLKASAAERGAFSEWRRRAAFFGACALLGVALAPAFFTNGVEAPARARVDTLAVGDGACHLVRTPGAGLFGAGEATLWDCGAGSLSAGERMIPRALRALGAWRVRTVVISHANLDHYCALPDLVRPLGVRRVVVGESFVQEAERRPDGPVAYVLADLERRGVEVRVVVAGDTLDLGAGVVATILSPARGAEWRRGNDASLVARIAIPTDAGERRMLMTGDIETEAMASLAQRGVDVAADAAEAPHHGSARPAAFEFVMGVDPAVVSQSTGTRRLGDERWDDVKAGRRWRTTAAEGAVTIEFLADGAVNDRAFLERRGR